MPTPEELCTDEPTVSRCWREAAVRHTGDAALLALIEGVHLPEPGSCPAGETCYRVAGAFAVNAETTPA